MQTCNGAAVEDSKIYITKYKYTMQKSLIFTPPPNYCPDRQIDVLKTAYIRIYVFAVCEIHATHCLLCTFQSLNFQFKQLKVEGSFNKFHAQFIILGVVIICYCGSNSLISTRTIKLGPVMNLSYAIYS